MTEDVRAWVQKANNDIQNIQNNVSSERIPWDTVVYHSQQAIEKLLKALSIARGVRPPRIHDLVALYESISPLVPDLELPTEQLESIGRYAVASRYPDITDINDVTGRAIVEQTLQMREILLAHLEESES